MQPVTAGGQRRIEPENERDLSPTPAKKQAGRSQTAAEPEPGGPANPLTKRQSGYATALKTLTNLARQFPGSGVDPASQAKLFTARTDSQPKLQLAATQHFVRQALEHNPSLAGRFLKEMHVKHLPAQAQSLIQGAVAGHAGKSLYQTGQQLAAQLRGFSSEQLKDIAGMVAAGATLPQAIRDELVELKRAPSFQATPSLKQQAAPHIAQAKQAYAKAEGVRVELLKLWQQVPSNISRSTELKTAALANFVFPAQILGAAVEAGVSTSVKPAEGLKDQFVANAKLTRGAMSDLGKAVNAAFRAAGESINSYKKANLSYQAAMGSSPPDTAAAKQAVGEMARHQAALPARAERFISLARTMVEDHAAFDKTLAGIVKEFELAAMALGAGGAISAKVGATTAAGSLGVELATAGVLAVIANGAESRYRTIP